jgi:hypothetical protein
MSRTVRGVVVLLRVSPCSSATFSESVRQRSWNGGSTLSSGLISTSRPDVSASV